MFCNVYCNICANTVICKYTKYEDLWHLMNIQLPILISCGRDWLFITSIAHFAAKTCWTASKLMGPHWLAPSPLNLFPVFVRVGEISFLLGNVKCFALFPFCLSRVFLFLPDNKLFLSSSATSFPSVADGYFTSWCKLTSIP